MFLNVMTNLDYSCGGFNNVVISGLIIHLIHTIYWLIQVVVPVLLVIFGMLDLGKAIIAQKEDEIKKGQQMLIKRAITAVIVFLVFSITKFAIGLVSNDAKVTGCMDCLINENCGDPI